jgi:hypothetical protein
MRSKLIAFALWTCSIVLVASGSAVAGSLITSAQIKNETIVSADVKNGSLTTKDLSKATQTALKGKAGAQGIQGIQGIQGAPGPSTTRSYFGSDDAAAASITPVAMDCPAGKVATGGGGYIVDPADNAKIRITQSFSNAVNPGDSPTQWIVYFENTSGGVVGVGVEVVCTP